MQSSSYKPLYKRIYTYIKSFFVKKPMFKGYGLTTDNNVSIDEKSRIKEILYLKLDNSVGLFEIMKVINKNRKTYYVLKHIRTGAVFTIASKFIDFFFIHANSEKDFETEHK